MAAIAYREIQPAQTCAAIVGSLNEPQCGVVQGDGKGPIGSGNGKPQNLGPEFREQQRVRALQLHTDHIDSHILTDLVFPAVSADRHPVAGEVLVLVPLDLKEGRDHVARVQLAKVPAVALGLVGDPDLVFERVGPHGLLIGKGVRLGDHHITTVAAAPVQIAAAGGALSQRRDHYEEVAANRQQRVFQPEGTHARVYIASLQPKDVGKVLNGRLQLVGHQTDLSQLDRHGLGSPVSSQPHRLDVYDC